MKLTTFYVNKSVHITGYKILNFDNSPQLIKTDLRGD